jgi:signal transduction histidine kinase
MLSNIRRKTEISQSRVDHTEDVLSITIKDNGMGISEEDIKHLSDRFFRGTNAMNIQGTGLGLHIVRKYLEVMGGQVSFSSELNKGTEVLLTFNQ